MLGAWDGMVTPRMGEVDSLERYLKGKWDRTLELGDWMGQEGEKYQGWAQCFILRNKLYMKILKGTHLFKNEQVYSCRPKELNKDLLDEWINNY